MPSGTEKESRSSGPRTWAPPAPHLFVVLEGERPSAGGVRCALAHVDEVLLVRAETRSAEYVRAARRLTVGVPDPKVSLRHARLRRGAGGWTFEDLGSTNGSRVNGSPVATRALGDGDTIQIGSTLLRVRLSLPTPEGTPEITAQGPDEELPTLVPALANELRVVERAARSKVPVLLLGETGTGKEVAARRIHRDAGREGPFVPVNCGALPKTLVEAQLFGHVRGAFSGATRDEPGFFRSADGGTLFLDEIGDLPADAQGVLLRTLQEGEVVPVGSTRAVPVDVRVIAATHRPIDAMVERGEFRRDLVARLKGFTHRLWPLRDRREDLGLLVASLLGREGPSATWNGRIAGDAVAALARYDWPLNVRELAHALARARAVATGGAIEIDHWPDEVAGANETRGAARDALSAADARLRDDLVERLERHRGNVSAVAREMKKAPIQIYRWMTRVGIDAKRSR